MLFIPQKIDLPSTFLAAFPEIFITVFAHNPLTRAVVCTGNTSGVTLLKQKLTSFSGHANQSAPRKITTSCQKVTTKMAYNSACMRGLCYISLFQLDSRSTLHFLIDLRIPKDSRHYFHQKLKDVWIKETSLQKTIGGRARNFVCLPRMEFRN